MSGVPAGLVLWGLFILMILFSTRLGRFLDQNTLPQHDDTNEDES